MARQKKKRKPYNGIQKKQEKNRQMQNFLKRIRYLASLCGCEKVYDSLPPQEKFFIFTMRSQILPPKTQVGHKVHPVILKNLHSHIKQWIKNSKVPFGPNQEMVIQEDVMTAGRTLYNYILFLKKDLFPEAEKFKEAFEPYSSLFEKDNNIFRAYDACLQILSQGMSFPNHKWFLFENTYTTNLSYDRGCGGYQVVVHVKKPMVKTITINSHNRPVYRLAFSRVNDGVFWLYVPSEPFRPAYQGSKKRLPIYIQAHAINRLLQRIDCLHYIHILQQIIYQINKPEIHFCDSGEILFAYYLMERKLGYFVVDIINSMVVLRTFLFITQDLTPESNKLKELAGLAREDISYWQIDRLSPFAKGDMTKSSKLKNLFKEAGINQLFDMKKHIGKNNKTILIHEKLEAFISPEYGEMEDSEQLTVDSEQ
ncbi:hypothetical protein DMA11_15980 [Marinilabiliaceae bacterium JC017]|nr:hypothetical protein DMA11_15980 [Marinilabiliaceae bacterium JC017]